MPNRTCSVDGCERPHKARGLCNTHAMRLARTGSTGDAPVRLMTAPTTDLRAAFFSRVDKRPDGCWLWTGALARGYGSMFDGQTARPAHRVSWELAGRVLVDGMDLDHLCRVRCCVNPDHLEQVTRSENLRRMWPHRSRI